MNSPEPMSSLEVTSDAELVATCRAGDRNAFGRIVERYQRLLCSLAYSATGQMSQSEDLAQDAFVDAWKQLGSLQDPEKLRSWLCGILRHKIGRLRRSDGMEPVCRAETLEDANDLASADEPVANLAMQKEEQAILWSALERVPELYRESLVLYYREHRSVEHVAAALDLTEDAVKQRLARGRKILQEQVLSFVEGALVRSTPGKLFTLTVLAALPEMVATPAKAAGIGAAAAQGGMMAKSTGVAVLLASFTSVAHFILTLRASLDQTRTPRERRAVVKITVGMFLGIFAFLIALYGLRAAAYRWWDDRALLAAAAQFLVLVTAVVFPWILLRVLRNQRALRSAERHAHPEMFADPRHRVGSVAGEYRSQATLFGVPLVHIRFATPDAGERPLFGWIAGGDRAYGLLFAWGAVAVAPISIGAVSVGILSVGAVSVGVISFGTLALGGFVIGAVSVGVKTYAWLSALGWETSQSGGFAVARIAAEGPVALAPHANDAVARAMLANPQGEQHHMIFLLIMVFCTLVPIAYYGWAVRRRLGGSPSSGSEQR